MREEVGWVNVYSGWDQIQSVPTAITHEKCYSRYSPMYDTFYE